MNRRDFIKAGLLALIAPAITKIPVVEEPKAAEVKPSEPVYSGYMDNLDYFDRVMENTAWVVTTTTSANSTNTTYPHGYYYDFETGEIRPLG